MKLKMSKETVIVQGIRPEEQLWGAYQFPRAYKTDEDGVKRKTILCRRITKDK